MRAWKALRILSLVIFILVIIGGILLAVGNKLLNRYLNGDGREAINDVLPINGILTYDKVSIHPIRDFPNISLKVNNLQILDSLAIKQGEKPILLDNLYLNAALTSFRKKQLTIKSVELDGLSLNISREEDGYSNFASLFKRKATDKQEIADWKVSLNATELDIRDLQVHKVDEIKKQEAHVYLDELNIKSKDVDSSYQLSISTQNLVVSPFPDKAHANVPLTLRRGHTRLNLSPSFASARLVDLELSGGNIDLKKDELGLTNYLSLIGAFMKEKGTQEEKILDLEGAKVTVIDTDFSLVDETRNRHLEARIVALATELNLDPTPEVEVELKLEVDQLALNSLKGAFLTDALVEGQVTARLNNETLNLKSSELKINNEAYDIQSRIPLGKRARQTLTIEKPDVLLENVRPLLTNYLQNRIQPYDVRGPMYAKAHITFTPGVRKARVDLDMRVENKTAIVRGQVIRKAAMSATIVNGLYDDERQYSEDKKNVRLLIHNAGGEIHDFQVATKNALVTYTPELGERLIAKARVTGMAASASKFLEHDRFSFRKGAFSLTANIDAPLTDLNDFITGTDIDLAMKDLEVYYPTGKTVLPLRTLDMEKNGDKTIFSIRGLDVDDDAPIHIRGEVEHLSSAILPDQDEQLKTKASIRATSISWEGLIGLFGKDGLISSARSDSSRQAKQSMKQTLTGIQESFSPTVDVTIDTVRYGDDVQFLDFNTGLTFEDKKTLILKETSFEIEGSEVTLDGKVVINQLDFTQFDFDLDLNNLDFDVLLPKFDYFGVNLIKQMNDQPDNMTMHVELSGELDDEKGLSTESINAFISYESFSENKFTGSIELKANPSTKKLDVVFGHSGHPENMNHWLGLEEYKFNKGWFTASFEFDDNYESLAQMVEESKVGLTIADSEVFIKEIGVTVPLSRIELASVDNTAFYHILLRSDSINQEVALDGTVKNIRHFAFRDTERPYEVDLSISSPRITWKKMKEVIAYASSDETQQSGKTIKESIHEVLKDFNPHVKLMVDTLEYSDKMVFNDIYAHAFMEGDSLKLDSASVAFSNSYIEANVAMDMSRKKVLPFNVNLGLTNIDISQILKQFDYFNQDVLRSAEKIDGKVFLELEMGAEIDLVNNGYIESKTDANLSVDVHNLVVVDLETINKLTKRINRKQRFQELRFAPIQSDIKVKGRRIEIAKTEVQSNAAQAFVEGTIDRTSRENLWITVPYTNLRKPELDSIPNKTGAQVLGRSLFIEWITSETKEDGETKVRLSKRKFFRQRKRGRDYSAYKKARRMERRKRRQSRN